MKISAIVLSKNQEDKIKNLIRNISFCSEIVIIDDKSTDKTAEVAKSFGAKVIIRPLNNDFAQQKNYGLSIASNDWVLFIDCDELVSQQLADEIKDIKFEDTDCNGFSIIRKDYFLGKKINYGEVYRKRYIRLARKDSGRWVRGVHEYWNVRGKICELKNPIIHKTNSSISEFLDKINFYSTLHAIENRKEGKKSTLVKIFLYPILKFIFNYLCKRGFLDGTYGLIHAILMSLHSFLSWSKLWITQKREK